MAGAQDHLCVAALLLKKKAFKATDPLPKAVEGIVERNSIQKDKIWKD